MSGLFLVILDLQLILSYCLVPSLSGYQTPKRWTPVSINAPSTILLELTPEPCLLLLPTDLNLHASLTSRTSLTKPLSCHGNLHNVSSSFLRACNKSITLVDGGSLVTRYIVEKQEAGGAWSKCAQSRFTYLTVEGLRPQQSYAFRVSAENKHGVSDPCEATSPVEIPASRIRRKNYDGEFFRWFLR